MLVSEYKNFYRLLDSGQGRKLEALGDFVVDRPSPFAVWDKKLSQAEWSRADATCIRKDDGGGFWNFKNTLDENKSFVFQYEYEKNKFNFKLKLTSFGHLGIFFEQKVIWEELIKRTGNMRKGKFLNLFAYTGAASVIMAKLGFEVFHVDSAKKIHEWARENFSLSGMNLDVKKHHLIHDDVRDFLNHSIKKNFSYDVILLDPPSWGYGKDKKKWEILPEVSSLIERCSKVLNPKGMIIMTSHTLGLQSEALKNLFLTVFGKNKFLDATYTAISGDLGILHANDKRVLPAGVFLELKL